MEPHFWHAYYRARAAPMPARHDHRDEEPDDHDYTMVILGKEIGVPAVSAREAVEFALRRLRKDGVARVADVFYRRERLYGCSRLSVE